MTTIPDAGLHAPPAGVLAAVGATVANDLAEPFLAADVGGTHARVALVRPDGAGSVTLLRQSRYLCADWPTLDAIVADFLGDPCAGSGSAAAHAVLACAGRLHGDDLINTNLPWTVSLAALRDRLRPARVDLVNDFEALAHAVPTLTAETSRHLIGPDRAGRPVDGGPVVVLGPGTGLGCAAVLQDAGDGHRILATEAGHIALSAGTQREASIVAWLAESRAGNGHAGDRHVPVERVLSGPGLVTLYRALVAIDGEEPLCDSPTAVSAAAADGSDRVAVEAVRLFCGWLGSFCADMALLYGASGGVLLAGGVTPALAAALRDGRFEARFLARGVLRPWLAQVPVRILDHGSLGIVGAAHWWLSRREHGRRGR